MPMYEQILRSAETWKANYDEQHLDATPARKLVVLACMDARLDLFRFLGLEIGHSHILRNAGGRATDDALRSMIVSSEVLGTREVVVIHHTQCGMHGVTNDQLRERVRASSGHDPADIDFMPFADEEASVREDVARIRECPYFPEPMTVWGCIYDVDDGDLRVVVKPDDDVSRSTP
ncbi:MAG: beta-class carbonic anhydrase [Acidimicrobiales bacterium]